MKRFLFKYISRKFYNEEDLENDYTQVTCPIPYNRFFPDGEYLIRGNKKEHRKEYYCCNNKWFLVEDIEKDNGHYYCDSNIYMLFPILSHKEYERMRKVGFKKLNKVWQRNITGYFNWLNLRKLVRDIHLDCIKHEKKRL